MSKLKTVEREEYRTYFMNCQKCGAGLGQWNMTESMANQQQQFFCEDCKRIKAWMPELVKAVLEALQKSKLEGQ